MKNVKWILMWIRGSRWKLVASVVLSLLGIVFMTVESYIFADVVDDILMPHAFDKLPLYLTAAFAVLLIRLACNYFHNILAEQAGQTGVYNLRSALFGKLLRQTPDFYAENRSGDLINKCSGDVEMVSYFLAYGIPEWVRAAFMLVFALLVFLNISWQYTLILFAVTPLSAIVGRRLGEKVHPAFKAAREQLSQLNTVVQENIAGNRVVKAFVREDYEYQKFQKENEEYKRCNIEANMIWLKYGPIIDSLATIITVLNLTIGATLVVLGNITLGQLTLFLSMAWTLNEPMAMLGSLINDTQRFRASVEKIQELYYSEVSLQDPDEVKTPETARGEIEFRDVSLEYGPVKVLEHVNLHIEPGQTVGIMGPTGSGKTCLINLIDRFIDVSAGSVLVDGVDVRDYALRDLRGRIALTMQDVFLFSDTVESNIAYGVPDAPMDVVVAAAKIADADGFIRANPDGYDMIVGERGTGLSGGQKQRISLARALAKHAPILILDDTTSAVDMETEEHIQEQLRRMPDHATTIIIAQRVSSVMHADKILILENGRISEQGTHAELMRKKGYYYNTCILQHGLLDDEV